MVIVLNGPPLSGKDSEYKKCTIEEAYQIYLSDKRGTIVDKRGLFIAAPKSHFRNTI